MNTSAHTDQQEIIEIYKIWSNRALRQCLTKEPDKELNWKQLEKCLGKIIEELAVIAEERARTTEAS